MSILPDNPALYGAGGCGAHQQVYGTIVVGGEEVEPLIYADFVSDPGVYTIDGVVSDVEDIFGSDPVNLSPFDPETDIIPGTGLVTGNPILVGDALTAFLAGDALILLDVNLPSSPTAISLTLTDLPGFNANWGVQLGHNTGAQTSRLLPPGASNELDTMLGAGVHRAAIKFLSDGSMKWSVDGLPVESQTSATTWADTNPNTLILEPGSGSRIQKLRLYDVDIDDAEMLTLSAL